MSTSSLSARRLASLVCVTALAALAASRTAHAYCRTSTCGNTTGTLCTPSQPGDCGKPLAWPSPCVGYSLQQDASREVSLPSATQVFEAAFQTWHDVTCPGGGHPRIEGSDTGPVACNQHEYNQDSGNANIIMFRDAAWPHAGQGDTLALTTVTYNLDTGEIYDADMELNSAQAQFTTTDAGVKDDLYSIATHEVGHFLGLSHTSVNAATMFADYIPGTTSLRQPKADDIAAICAAYPPGAPIPATCDATPRHGFSSTCASAPVSSGCCSVAPGAPASPGEAPGRALGLGALAAALAARRLARRRSR